jgi:hypothetical protein
MRNSLGRLTVALPALAVWDRARLAPPLESESKVVLNGLNSIIVIVEAIRMVGSTASLEFAAHHHAF